MILLIVTLAYFASSSFAIPGRNNQSSQVTIHIDETNSHPAISIIENSDVISTTETMYDTTSFVETEEDEDSGIGKATSYPCSCAGGACSCCTGKLLENININIRQRLCTNLTFDPEDLKIGVKIAWNQRVLYENKVSGKNPPPICLPIPRLTALRVCLRFSNVYFIGRNIHACAAFEGQWNREAAFVYNFDCMRLGRDGVALVKPEEGGGLPALPATDVDDIEDYDENVVDIDKPQVR